MTDLEQRVEAIMQKLGVGTGIISNMHPSGLFSLVSTGELCRMAATFPPSEWPIDIISPSSLGKLSIFGHSQTAMWRENSMTIIDALVTTNLCESNTLARTAIKGNAVSINRVKVKDINYILTKKDALSNLDAIVLENGKRNYGIIELCD